HVERQLLRCGLSTELESFPRGGDGGAQDAVAREDRLSVLVFRREDEPARLPDEAGQLAVLEGDKAVAFGNDDAAAVGDDVLGALDVGPATGILPLGYGGKDGRRRCQIGWWGEKVLPLIGERSAQCTRKCLDESHS